MTIDEGPFRNPVTVSLACSDTEFWRTVQKKLVLDEEVS